MGSKNRRRKRGAGGPRVLLLTAPVGEGHMSIGHELATSLRAERAKVDVSYALVEAGLFSHVPQAYHWAVRSRVPVWSAYYGARQHSDFVRALNSRWMRRALRDRLNGLKCDRYDAVVVTQSLYCHVLDELTPQNAPITVMPTDLFGGPKEWFLGDGAQYFVGSKQMRDLARAAGIAPGAVQLRRIPTIARPAPQSLDALRVKSVLVVGGSEGAGPLRAVAKGVRLALPDVSLTIACGYNGRLRRHLEKTMPPRVVRGYIPRLGADLSTFDLVISKPGSATIMELLDTSKPFLLMRGIPGIESANAATTMPDKDYVLQGVHHTKRVLRQLVSPGGALTPEGIRLYQYTCDLGTRLPDRRLTLADITSTGDAGAADAGVVA